MKLEIVLSSTRTSRYTRRAREPYVCLYVYSIKRMVFLADRAALSKTCVPGDDAIRET